MARITAVWRLPSEELVREVFDQKDVERVRLVELALRRGFSLDDVERIKRESHLLDHYLQHLFPNGVPDTQSAPEAAEALGIDLSLLRRVWQAAGLSDQGETAYEDDVAMLSRLNTAIAARLPEEALLQAIRVFSDAMNRVAETEARLVHFYIHDPLRASQVSPEDSLSLVDASVNQLQPLVEPALLYLHSKGLARATREDLLMHLAEEVGLRPASSTPAQFDCSIVFLDLSSFTPLTAQHGDVLAAQILDRFAELVRNAAAAWEGRVVKQLGDGFMLSFSDPCLAVTFAMQIERETRTEEQFPGVRAGIHHGSVLFRDGDYVGTTVNIASRIASEAERRQVLVSHEVRKGASDMDLTFVSIGKRTLKGIEHPLELFEARDNADAADEYVIDPVCGMQLRGDAVAARLAFEGADYGFCSEDCLKAFLLRRS